MDDASQGDDEVNSEEFTPKQDVPQPVPSHVVMGGALAAIKQKI